MPDSPPRRERHRAGGNRPTAHADRPGGPSGTRGLLPSPREDAQGEGSGGRTARPGVNRGGAGRPARRAVQCADPRGPRWQPDKRPIRGQCRRAVTAPGGPGTARGDRRKGVGHANKHPPAFRRSSRLRRSCRYPLVVMMDGAHRLPELRPLPPARAVRLAAGRGNPSPATEAGASDGKRGRRLDRWEGVRAVTQRHNLQPEGHTRAEEARDEREQGTTDGRHDAESVRKEGSIQSGQLDVGHPGDQLECSVPILGRDTRARISGPAHATILARARMDFDPRRLRSPTCTWAGQRTGKRRGGGLQARVFWVRGLSGGTGGRQGSLPLPFQPVKVTRDQSGCPRGDQMPYE